MARDYSHVFTGCKPVGLGSYDFLHNEAHELDRFHWSGSVMLAVDQYLKTRGVDLSASSDQVLSDSMSVVRGNWWLVFQYPGARQLAETLKNLEITLTAIAEYLDRDDDWPDDLPANAVLDGITILSKWLSRIKQSQAGLLTVG